MPDDCIFCKIAQGKAPARIVFQDDDLVAFHDIAPVTPVHILIVPRQHITGVSEIDEETTALIGQMTRVAAQLARGQNVETSGYRLIMNNGPDSGQMVMHLHMHLLAGRRLGRLG